MRDFCDWWEPADREKKKRSWAEVARSQRKKQFILQKLKFEVVLSTRIYSPKVTRSVEALGEEKRQIQMQRNCNSLEQSCDMFKLVEFHETRKFWISWEKKYWQLEQKLFLSCHSCCKIEYKRVLERKKETTIFVLKTAEVGENQRMKV